MGKIFVTSDWHFNHDKPFVWQARGFSSVQEMNEEIVRRHNEVVSDEDEVYILGDCCMSTDLEVNKELISRMHGRKHFILGNHCTTYRIEMYKELGEVLGYAHYLKYRKYNFFLCHYPVLCANYDDNKPLKAKVICLCGHTHAKDAFADFDKGLIYHCEVDAHNCYPVLLDDVIEEMKQKNQECIDMLQFVYCRDNSTNEYVKDFRNLPQGYEYYITDDTSQVYIIPINNNKPLKVVFE